MPKGHSSILGPFHLSVDWRGKLGSETESMIEALQVIDCSSTALANGNERTVLRLVVESRDPVV